MSYPPADLVTGELEDQLCRWNVQLSEDDGYDCDQPAVTTRYETYTRRWWPVCEDHRGPSLRPVLDCR